MYGWLWRHLPGPALARAGQCVVLLAGVIALLFFVVFPAASPHLPFNQVTVNNPSLTSTPSPAATATPD